MAARPADPDRSRVVLVGTGRYDHLPDLPAVPNNLVGLTRTLQDPARWGVPERNCRVVGEPRSPQDVQAMLRAAASGVESGGLLLVYFAGHGIIDIRTGELHLAVASSDVADAYATAVPYDWVRRIVLESAASQRVVILDCCYAGRAIAGMGAGATVAAEVAIDRACVLVAASANRLALAPPDEPYTAFTGVLLDLLNAGVAGGPDPLDLATCYEEIVKIQRERGRPLPELRARNGGERIPLVHNPATEAGGTDPVGKVYIAQQRAGPELAGAAIAVLAHSPTTGTLGVRLDLPSPRSPADLLGDARARTLGAPPVFDGGPLCDVVILLVSLRDLASAPAEFHPVSGALGTLPPETDVDVLAGAVDQAYVCLGYLGWPPGGLASEVEAGNLVDTGTGLPGWLMQRARAG
jgi:putative transcriptional regulator